MWKTLGGQCIYEAENHIRVFQNVYYRWLKFDSEAIQTLINRRHPERPGLKYIKFLTLAARLEPGDCCLLGLGGAGAVHALSPYLDHSKIMVVENNPEVIFIAKTYFMADQIKNLNIVREDADVFVQKHSERYRHLLVDLFDAFTFPNHCNNKNFFYYCRQMLIPNGILAVNLANFNEHWRIFKNIREIFPSTTVALPVKGTANMIILASAADSVNPLLNLLKKSQNIKKLSWDARWGCLAQTR